MAKDLPYFKFYCSEWNDGDITLEEINVQGVFINVCSYYWSNECMLTTVKLYKRFKHFKNEIDTLIQEGLIREENEYININFLDEQKQESEERSKVKSKGGKASAKARKLKKLEQENNRTLTESQQVLNSCSTESQLLREEKRREEEIREDNNILDFEKFTTWFNLRRTQYLEIPSNIKRLTYSEKTTLALLKKDYTKEDFEKAMYNLCNDDWANKNNQVLCSYFLQTKIFNKFLSIDKKPMLTKKQRTLRGGVI